MIDYLFKRVLAYTIDMLLVSIVVSSLTTSSIVNFQIKKYNKYYNEYIDMYNIYSEQSDNDIKTCDDLKTAIDEEKLTEEKYVSKYEELADSLEKEELTAEDFDTSCLTIVEEYNANKMTEEEYLDKVEYYYYHTEKNSVVAYIISIIISILYFVFFQGFTEGQTLGKKIMRLKVVASNGDKVDYKKLFIRSIFLFSILYYLLTIITILIIPESLFANVTNVLYLLNSALSLMIGITIIVDKDRKGLHGIISKTKVIMLDFKGNEININKKKKITEEIDNNVNKKEKAKTKKTNKVNKSKPKEK